MENLRRTVQPNKVTNCGNKITGTMKVVWLGFRQVYQGFPTDTHSINLVWGEVRSSMYQKVLCTIVVSASQTFNE